MGVGLCNLEKPFISRGIELYSNGRKTLKFKPFISLENIAIIVRLALQLLQG
jgi:hypothetical protein